MNIFRLKSPSTVGFVWTTDWHLSDRAPGRRTGSYAQDILGKIHHCGELAHSRNAVKLCGGDVFHIKDPQSPSNGYRLVNPLIRECSAMPYGKVFGAHGNHDLLADRTESLATQPLGALLAAGVYHDLSSEPLIFQSADGEVSVAVEAYPYADDMVTLQRVLDAPARPTLKCPACFGDRQEGDICEVCENFGVVPVQYRVAIMHQYGHPGGQGAMFKHPTIGYDQVADTDYDMMLWGHDHSREKTVTVGNVTHIRLGSLARAALSSDEVDRPVVAAGITFTIEGVTLKELPIPVKPLEIAFVTADVETNKVGSSEEVTSFLQEMDVAVSEVDTTDPISIIKSLCGEDKPVYDSVMEVCEF